MTFTRISKHFQEGSPIPVIIGGAIVAVAIPITIALLIPGPEVDLYLAWGLTCITAVGILATFWTWLDTLLEARTVGADDRALRLIASANVRREAIRIGVLLALFWIGFSIVIQHADPTVNRSALIELSVALAGNSVLDRLERRDTGRVLRAEIKAERAIEAATGRAREAGCAPSD